MTLFTRRQIIGGALAATATGSTSAASAVAPARPTIVLVVLDDMRASDWQALPRTRTLLGERGTTFPNFFLTTPVCSPSRATLLTGMYSHNHGVVDNIETADGKPGGYAAYRRHGRHRQSIAVALKRAGYRTALIGKYLNLYEETAPDPGWDEWLATGQMWFSGLRVNDNGRRVVLKRKYSTDVFAARAVRFIRRAKREQPLFLYFAPQAPHEPATPAKRHRGRFADAPLPTGPAFNEEDISDKPTHIAALPRFTGERIAELEAYERKRLESLLAVDEAIARIWEALRRTGRQDAAHLMIASDNGYLLGEHRITTKGVPYDGSARVPMLAIGPRFTPGADERIVGNIDVAPTIADLAGATFAGADGRSLLAPGEREEILLEGFRARSGPAYSALRTRNLLYAEWDTGERELYDYRTDPAELGNLLRDGASDAQGYDVAALRQRLSDLRRCSGATACG